MIQEVLIIDGYNVIHAAPDLLKLKELSLEHCRSKLISSLSNYGSYKNKKVIIVFDGKQGSHGPEQIEEIEGIIIIFSKDGETADMVIEKLVSQFQENYTVFVATSDYAEQRIIFGKGAYRMSARELWNEVINSKNENHEFFQDDNKPYRGQIGWRLNKDVFNTLEKWRREK